ncbi:MAG TPA: hypothetical protein VFK47_05130, partial [Ktedonobacteraceae bacterium]|nr:hypothetical protein [Ktedonobacteraceae bacterium]
MTNEQEKQLIEQMSRIEELLKPETKSLTTSVKESSRDWTNDFLFHTLFEQYTEWARELVRIGLEAS